MVLCFFEVEGCHFDLEGAAFRYTVRRIWEVEAFRYIGVRCLTAVLKLTREIFGMK